jgi:hypothetical protein
VLADPDRTHSGRCRLVPHDDVDFPAFLLDPVDGMAIGIRMVVDDEPGRWSSA